jgi:putative ABC transport system substrate-binding protein
MRRRDFIKVIAGSATAWPLAANAQQPERMKRLGVLMGYAENDPESQLRLAAFVERLAALGWSAGRNLQLDVRWTAGEVSRASTFAKELVGLHAEAILSNTTPVTAALQRETKTIPIVFVVVSDPVGSGFVQSLPRPGANITGFMNVEPLQVQKWLELLKEVAPGVTRVAVMFNPETAPYSKQYLQHLDVAAQKFGVKILASPVYSVSEFDGVISSLGRETGSGLIAMTDAFMTVHRKAVIDLTTQHKVPLVYFVSNGPREGALISYGVDIADIFRRAAPYIDRILKGAKPSDLPVQAPVKFELVINLKTAKMLGLTVPPQLLARADEVIE